MRLKIHCTHHGALGLGTCGVKCSRRSVSFWPRLSNFLGLYFFPWTSLSIYSFIAASGADEFHTFTGSDASTFSTLSFLVSSLSFLPSVPQKLCLLPNVFLFCLNNSGCSASLRAYLVFCMSCLSHMCVQKFATVSQLSSFIWG